MTVTWPLHVSRWCYNETKIKHKGQILIMKRIYLTLVAGLLVLGWVPSSLVVAQDTGSGAPETQEDATTKEQRIAERQARYEARVERLTAEREARILERCEQASERADQIADRVTAISTARGNLIDAMIDKLERFSQRAESNGLDASALQEDIPTLQTYADELDELWATYQAALEDLKNAQCSEDGDDFHNALEVAKQAHADLRAKYKEIKDFMVSDIKADLQAIREQVVGDDSGDESDSSDATEDNTDQSTDDTTNEDQAQDDSSETTN
jgi:hypothetical protein